MNLRISGAVAFATFVLLPFQLTAVAFQPGSLVQEPLKTHKVVSSQTYEHVLDMVFPRNEANPDYDLVLRFEPSFAPESQIVVKSPIVVERTVGKVEVVEYTSLSGNIYRRLNSVMANGGREDAAEMARLVEVQKRVIEVPIAQVRQWRATLADSVGASMKSLEQRSVDAETGVGTITLDGTFYSLWYDQVGSHISFRLLDHEVSNRQVSGVLKLVRWMNTVRRDIEKRR
ncbi:MAG TPA: hypothetical protein VJH03_25150 [Blastocatellia bacterium]|nr:hypothetical protein [Blastocatellia bacterium]